jgi:Flp pilus assembly protein TadD
VERIIKKGLQALMRADAKAAQVGFCQAEQLGAQNTTVFMGLAQAQLMQSDLDAALHTLDRELELRPGNTGAFELRGDVLIRMGRSEEAQQAWLKALGATRATDALVQRLLRANRDAARAALRSGDLARADRLLRRAIALAPHDRELCLELASVLDKGQRAAAAARWRDYAATLGG